MLCIFRLQFMRVGRQENESRVKLPFSDSGFDRIWIQVLSRSVVQEVGCALLEPRVKPLAPPGPSDQVARVALVQTVNSEVLDRLNAASAGGGSLGFWVHPFSDFQCVRWTTSSGCFVGEFPRSDGRWGGDSRVPSEVPLLWDTWPPGPGLPHSTCSRGGSSRWCCLGWLTSWFGGEHLGTVDRGNAETRSD